MTASLLLATVVSSKAASIGARPSIQGPPLLEVNRIEFQPSFVPSPWEPAPIVVSRRAPVGYAVSYQDLFVVDLTDGHVQEVIDLGAYGPPYSGSQFDVTLNEDGTTPRLFAWNSATSTPLVIFDLSDPRHPAAPAAIDFAHRSTSTTPIPGGSRVLVGTLLYDPDLLTVDAEFFPKTGPPYSSQISAMGVGGRAGLQLVGVADWNRSLSTYAFTVYDVTTGSPAEIASLAPPTYVERILLDRDGRFAVLGWRDYSSGSPTSTFHVVDLATGAIVSDFVTPGNGFVATLVQGGGASALVTIDIAGADVVDLTDPTAPRAVGRIPAAIAPGGYDAPYRGALVSSSTGPYAFISALGDRAVLIVDVRTATVAGRFDTGATPPGAIAIGEGTNGARSLLVVGQRIIGLDTPLPGGTAELVAADASNPASPRETGRMLRNQPRVLDGFAAALGSLGVAVDYASNSIALVRLKDGNVLDVSGFSGLNGPSQFSFDRPSVLTRGPWVLAWGEEGFDVFRIVDDRLIRVTSLNDYWTSLVSAAIRSDGTVVDFEWNYLAQEMRVATYPPGGGGGRLHVDNPPYYTNFALSPDDRRAILGLPYSYDEPGRARSIDLTDVSHPAWGWEVLPSFWSAQFTPDGRDLFATFADNRDYSFETGLFDSGTGQEIGDRSARIDKFFYEDIGVLLGNHGAGRAVLWRWTYLGWATLLFDTSSGTPVLSKSLPEYYVSPEYAPRDDAGWYECHGWDDGSIFVSDADGNQVFGARSPKPELRYPSEVRRGYLATTFGTSIGGAGISLWRDVALDRPPVAAAGGDRTVECSSPSGTVVHLDGSGSTDPDSTPGTSDDIASYSWAIDGIGTVEQVAADVTLPIGPTHASLTVTDTLGFADSNDATLTVQDTLAPDVSLDLTPVLENIVWAQLWKPVGTAVDRCEGDLGPPAERLRLPSGAASAPTAFVYSPERSIELRGSGDGLGVRLIGPSAAEMTGLWGAAVARGGFALFDGAPVGLPFAEAEKGKDVDLLERWELGGDGSLVRATAYGSGGDHLVDATAQDQGGRAATTSISLRGLIAGVCATAPSDVRCVRAPAPAPGPANRQSGRTLATAR